jgi:transposase
MRTRKIYSAATKFDAALELIKGEKTAVEIARGVGCHPTVVAEWKRMLEEHGKGVFENEVADNEREKKIAKLERTIGRLTMENDFLEHVLDRSR